MENDSKQYYVKLPLWKKCTFGMIDSANNFSWSYISSFLAIYLTDTFLIPAATVSLMFLLCRFWDAINDPIVGYLADRTRSRWGRYRPWIMFASAPLFITTALLFWPHPEWAVGVKTAYVVILYALVVLFYTMVNLTYGSLNSVVTQDPGRTRLSCLLASAVRLHRLHAHGAARHPLRAGSVRKAPQHGLFYSGCDLRRVLHPDADPLRKVPEGSCSAAAVA